MNKGCSDTVSDSVFSPSSLLKSQYHGTLSVRSQDDLVQMNDATKNNNNKAKIGAVFEETHS